MRVTTGPRQPKCRREFETAAGHWVTGGFVPAESRTKSDGKQNVYGASEEGVKVKNSNEIGPYFLFEAY